MKWIQWPKFRLFDEIWRCRDSAANSSLSSLLSGSKNGKIFAKQRWRYSSHHRSVVRVGSQDDDSFWSNARLYLEASGNFAS